MFWGILMTTVTISLPDSLREFIDREVENKGYGNVSEYVRGPTARCPKERSGCAAGIAAAGRIGVSTRSSTQIRILA